MAGLQAIAFEAVSYLNHKNDNTWVGVEKPEIFHNSRTDRFACIGGTQTLAVGFNWFDPDLYKTRVCL